MTVRYLLPIILLGIPSGCGDQPDAADEGTARNSALETVVAEDEARSVAESGNASLDEPPASPERATGNGSDGDAMRWSFHRTAAGPRLTFGEPQTDNVRLMLRCGDGQVSVHFMRPADMVERRPGQLTIASGGMQWRAEISSEESQLGGMSIRASAPLSSAPITAFRSGQSLEVRWGPETIALPGQQGGAVQQFFNSCPA